jgi:hypothetical protein
MNTGDLYKIMLILQSHIHVNNCYVCLQVSVQYVNCVYMYSNFILNRWILMSLV